MFYKEFKTKEEELEHYKNHFRYYILNPWNGHISYANCVKLHRLGLNREDYELAYQFIYSPQSRNFYNDVIENILADFTKDTGYSIIFNGRNNGYIVLVNQYDSHTIDFFDNEEDEENIEYGIRILKEFDKLCDRILEAFKEELSYYRTFCNETEEYSSKCIIRRKGESYELEYEDTDFKEMLYEAIEKEKLKIRYES